MEIPHGEVIVVNCRVIGMDDKANRESVLIEASLDACSCLCVVEGIQQINGCMVEVVVGNPGPETITIPAASKLLTARVVSPTDRVVVSPVDGVLNVTVRQMLIEPGEDPANYVPDTLDIPCPATDNESPLVYEFPDGTTYCLPPGLCLDGLSDDDASRAAQLVRRYDSVFSKTPMDVGCCELVPHEINVVDSTPVRAPYRRVPPHLVTEVKSMLQGLLEQGLIRRSSSNYASAVVLVKKKSGALRLCIDYRQLNAKCLRDAFPLPRIEESLEAMGGACLFSSLDLAHGYFQVTMHPDSVSKTAFRVPWGLYEFTRMPQGLMNSPSTFERIMELIFGDMNLSELVLYLDDLLVFSRDMPEHLDRLEKVFQRLHQHGLKLNGKKCSLFRQEVAYLGHVVSKEGVAVDPEKIARIRDWPIPTTQSELRSFLGLASYYRRYVSQFAKVAAPLHALTGKGVAAKRYKPARLSDWSNEAQSSFESLKAALCDAPILQYPRSDREFVLDVDASLKGLGACLSQVDDSGNLRPIAFASRGLRGAEKNYSDLSSFKLELLALKWAVTDKCKPYTLGVHSVVYTDHNPLAHLKTAKLGATEHRWVAQLAPFDMEVKYRPGSLNQCADALSRCPSNMSAGEAFTALHFAMDSTLVPQEVRDCHIQEVTVAELGVGEGLTPSVLPSYTLEQLSAMQKADNVLHHVWEMRLAGWEPGIGAR